MNKLINTEARGTQRRRVEKKEDKKKKMEGASNVRINETKEEKNVKRERMSTEKGKEG